MLAGESEPFLKIYVIHVKKLLKSLNKPSFHYLKAVLKPPVGERTAYYKGGIKIPQSRSRYLELGGVKNA